MDVYGSKGSKILDRSQAKTFLHETLSEFDEGLQVTDKELDEILDIIYRTQKCSDGLSVDDIL